MFNSKNPNNLRNRLEKAYKEFYLVRGTNSSNDTSMADESKFVAAINTSVGDESMVAGGRSGSRDALSINLLKEPQDRLRVIVISICISERC